MKKLSLLLILSLSTTHASTALNPDVAYKTSNWITEHWFRKSCTNQKLRCALVYQISNFTTFPYFSPQPFNTMLFESNFNNLTSIRGPCYQQDEASIISCTTYSLQDYAFQNDKNKHRIQVTPLRLYLTGSKKFTYPKRPYTNTFSTRHEDVKYNFFDIKTKDSHMAPLYVYPISVTHDLIAYNNSRLNSKVLIFNKNEHVQSLSGNGVTLNEIILNPNDRSMLVELANYTGPYAIAQFKYDNNNNKYYNVPIILHRLSCLEYCYYNENIKYTIVPSHVIFCPKRNTLYCYYIEDTHGKHIKKLSPDTKHKIYNEYVVVVDLKNTKNIKKIPIKNKGKHIFGRFVAGAKDWLGIIFFSNKPESCDTFFTMLNTQSIQKQTPCIDTSNMITMKLLEKCDTFHELYRRLEPKHNTQLSQDSKQLIHAYTDEKEHRIVQIDTTTGERLGLYKQAHNNFKKRPNRDDDYEESILVMEALVTDTEVHLISTSLGFVALITNINVLS